VTSERFFVYENYLLNRIIAFIIFSSRLGRIFPTQSDFLRFVAKKEEIKVLLSYHYKKIAYSLYVDWTNPDGQSVVHRDIIGKLGRRFGASFFIFSGLASKLDGKADILYEYIDQYTDEHYAFPYDPKFRTRILRAFSDLCACLEESTDLSDSEEAQVVTGLFLSVQGKFQETIGIYLLDNAYHDKHRYRRRKLEEWAEMVDESEMSYEMEEPLIQMLDLSHMLGCLTEIQRQRIVKHLLLRYTLQEIADQEGVSLQAVKVSLTAALKKLRNIQ